MANHLSATSSSDVLVRLIATAALVGAVHLPAAAENPSRGFVDPLDVPAVAVSAAAPTKPMMATARAGERLVAVGMRGVIVLSDDGGRSWRQAASPVQSDLTAVTFRGAQRGWIVGHDGVILATMDAGSTWTRQLDGRLAARQFVAHYQAQVDAGRQELQKLLRELERNYQRGPALPFLDIAFDDERRGFAVGPFGMMAATTDGGRTWLPAMELVDNPDLLSLYAARKIGRELYFAGERGMVYRLDRTLGRFVRLPTGYSGSLFGIVGNDRVLVAYGLRGTVAVSTDGGANWKIATLPVPAGLVGADVLADGRVVLASITGMLWLGGADGDGFKPLPMEYGAPATTVLSIASDAVLVGGLRGVAVQHLPEPARR